MVDKEVEDTLREIRERVRAGAQRTNATAASRVVNEAGELRPTPQGAAVVAHSHSHQAADALSRLEANLATAERARNRLPPLMSNRTGWVARLELWVKGKIKRATHWFTWEQVNFNSAAYHALRDALSALTAYEQQLARMRAEITAEMAPLQQKSAEASARLSEFESRLTKTEARINSENAQLRVELSSGVTQLRDEQRAIAESLRGEQLAYVEGLRREQQARAAELQNEQRERIESLLDEQRVCFKQLSLEAGETAILNDRARRDTEARLEEIRRKVMSDKEEVNGQ
jgi:hypothetical protein